MRVAPYMEEFPTERTAMRTTTFMTESRPCMPASAMAMMNGEALASTLEREMRALLVYGTRRPMIVIETM